MSRFIIAIIVTALSATIAPAQSGAIRIGAASVQGSPGEEVLIPVSVSGATAVGAMHIELIFDPAVLEFKSVTKGQLMSGNAMLDSSATADRLIVGLVSLDPVSGDGVAAAARFVVKGEPGATSHLKLENLRAWDNATHADLLLQAEDGLFTSVGTASGLPLTREHLPWLIAGGAVVALLAVMFLRKPKPAK